MDCLTYTKQCMIGKTCLHMKNCLSNPQSNISLVSFTTLMYHRVLINTHININCKTLLTRLENGEMDSVGFTSVYPIMFMKQIKRLKIMATESCTIKAII